MGLRFDGDTALIYPEPTPEGRLDIGIATGVWGISGWIKPEDLSVNREIINVQEIDGAGRSICRLAMRLSGGDAAGSLLIGQQGSLFGMVTLARSAAGVLTQDTWHHVLGVWSASTSPHIYVDGTEVAYGFTRTDTTLPAIGGWEIIIGGCAVNLGRWMGWRLAYGDPGGTYGLPAYTTSPGAFFKGGMANFGIFFASAHYPEMVESLSQGFSPLFLASYIPGSSVSPGLLMTLPLFGEDASVEYDVQNAIGHADIVGLGGSTATAGTLTWADPPAVFWPAEPMIDGPGPPLPERAPKLCLPFYMPTAGLYADPGDGAAVLPIVYGDFSEGGLRGPVPAIQIDRTAFVYCAAFHPVVGIDSVYIDDILQTSGYTVSLANNYQNQGVIATITFTAQPAGAVSWRGRGMYDATGSALMENVIDQIVHLLVTWGNFDAVDNFEAAAQAEAHATVEGLGYRTAFVVRDWELTQTWLTEMLFNVMGHWRVNGRDEIAFFVDAGGRTVLIDGVAASVIAERDCLNGDDGVTVTLDARWLVNKLTAYYLWSYSTGWASSRLVSPTDAASVTAYGPLERSVTLRGLRRQVDVETWADVLFQRQGGRGRLEGGQVTFTLTSSQFAHLCIGDRIAFTWPYGPTRELGNSMVNEVLRIDTFGISAERGGAFDVTATALGAYVSATVDGSRLLTPVER